MKKISIPQELKLIIAFIIASTLMLSIGRYSTIKATEVDTKSEISVYSNNIKEIDTNTNTNLISKKLSDELKKSEEEIREKEIKDSNTRIKENMKQIVANSKRNYVYYNPYNITEKSSITETAMYKLTAGTKLETLVDVLIDGEDKYNINAVAVLAIVCLESSYGTSDRAINNNNLTGYAVYNDTSDGRHFESWTECIEETYKLLAKDYLSENGKYYCGKSIWNVNVHYSTPTNWSEQINDIVDNFKDKVN